MGDNYYADAEYRLTMNSSDGETNYVDTSIYDKMRLVFKAENAGKPVNLTVIAGYEKKGAKTRMTSRPSATNWAPMKARAAKRWKSL